MTGPQVIETEEEKRKRIEKEKADFLAKMALDTEKVVANEKADFLAKMAAKDTPALSRNAIEVPALPPDPIENKVKITDKFSQPVTIPGTLPETSSVEREKVEFLAKMAAKEEEAALPPAPTKDAIGRPLISETYGTEGAWASLLDKVQKYDALGKKVLPDLAKYTVNAVAHPIETAKKNAELLNKVFDGIISGGVKGNAVGAVEGIVHMVTDAGKAVVALTSEITPEAINKQFRSKGTWDSSMSDAWNVKVGNRRPTVPSTAAERYSAVDNTVDNLVVLGLTPAIGKLVGAEARGLSFLETVGAPAGTPTKEILSKYVPEFFKKQGYEELNAMVPLLRSRFMDVVNKGTAEGIGGGAIYGVLSSENGDDIALNAANNMLGGLVLGNAFELGIKGISKVNQKFTGKIKFDTPTILRQQLLEEFKIRGVSQLKGDKAFLAINDINAGVSLVEAFQRGIPAGEVHSLTLPTELVPKNPTDKIGVHHNSNGTSQVLVLGDGTYEAKINADKLKETKITKAESIRDRGERLEFAEWDETPEAQAFESDEAKSIAYHKYKTDFEKNQTTARKADPTLAEPLKMYHGTAIANNIDWDPKALGSDETNLVGQGSIYSSEAPDITSGEGASYANIAPQRMANKLGTPQVVLDAYEATVNALKEHEAKLAATRTDLQTFNLGEHVDINDALVRRGLDIKDPSVYELAKMGYLLEDLIKEQNGVYNATSKEFFRKLRTDLVETYANNQPSINPASKAFYINSQNPFELHRTISNEGVDGIIGALRRLQETGRVRNLDGTVILSETKPLSEPGWLAKFHPEHYKDYLDGEPNASSKIWDAYDSYIENFDARNPNEVTNITTLIDALEHDKKNPKGNRGQDIRDLLKDELKTDENPQPAAVNAILNDAGFDAITHIGGGKGKPHLVVVPFHPEMVINAFTHYEPKVSQAQLAEFNATGHYTGQEVGYNGNSYIYQGMRSDGLIRITDINSGQNYKVKRDQLVNVPDAATYYLKDGKWVSDKNIVSVTTLDEVTKRAEAQFSPEDQIIIRRNKFMNEIAAEDLSTVFAGNGYYFEHKPGGYEIRKVGAPRSDKPILAPTFKDLEAFAYGKAEVPVSKELIADVQGTHAPDLGKLQAVGNRQLNTAARGQVTWGRQAWDRWFNLNKLTSGLVPIEPMLASLNRQYGLDLMIEKLGVSTAIRKMSSHMAPYLAEFKTIFAPLNPLGGVERNIVMKFMETRSEAEYRQRGLNGLPMAADEMAIAENWAKTSTSDDRMVANRFAVKMAQYEKLYADKPQVLEKEIASLIENGNFGYELTQRQLELASEIRRYRAVKDINAPDNPGLLAVFGLADAIENPQGALSQADFAAANPEVITPEIIKMDLRYKKLIRQLGKEAGIKDVSLIEQYVPHIKRYIGSDVYSKDLLAGHFGNKAQAKWIHELARIDYLDPQEMIRDPITATSKYIHSTFKRMHVDPAMDALRAKMEKFALEHPELPNAAKFGLKYVDEIERQANGWLDPKDRIGDDAQISYKTGIAENKKLAVDWSLYWNKYVEVKAQGFKPLAGVRDGTTAIQTYAYLLSPSRAKNFMKVTYELMRNADNRKTVSQLASTGIIPGLEITRNLGNTPVEIGRRATQGFLEGLSENTIKYLDIVSEEGFKWSLQPQVYKFMHAGAYVETTQTLGKELSKLAKGEITPEQFRNNISLDIYDPATDAHFSGMIADRKYGEATHFLAQRTGDMAVGQYGMLNNPMFFNTAAGRVFGQFSHWPLWQLQNIANGQTSKGRFRRAVTLGVSAGLGYAAAKESGIDFNNWSLNPAQMLPDIGPLGQWYQDFKEAGDFSSPLQSRAASALANTSAYLANPIPNALMSIIKAGERYVAGDPLHIVGGQLMNFKIDSKQYKSPDFNIFDF